MSLSPILLWFRRDLRLDDHPALSEAAAAGRPVIPVFIHDETVEALGAAPKWRLGLGLEAFAAALEGAGARLILRRGRAADVIDALIREIVVEMGATAMTITHDMSSVRAIADRVAMLHAGRIQWTGPVSEMDATSDPYVQQFIHGRADGPIASVR